MGQTGGRRKQGQPASSLIGLAAQAASVLSFPSFSLSLPHPPWKVKSARHRQTDKTVPWALGGLSCGPPSPFSIPTSPAPLSHVCVTRVCRFEALAPPFFRCFLSSPKRPLHQRDQKSPSHLAPRYTSHTVAAAAYHTYTHTHIHTTQRTHHLVQSNPAHTHTHTHAHPRRPRKIIQGRGVGAGAGAFAAGWSCSRPSATISEQRRRPGTPINAP